MDKVIEKCYLREKGKWLVKLFYKNASKEQYCKFVYSFGIFNIILGIVVLWILIIISDHFSL
jgi:hypothetical protein